MVLKNVEVEIKLGVEVKVKLDSHCWTKNSNCHQELKKELRLRIIVRFKVAI